MDTGTKISGIAHVGLIAAAVFGGTFAADPLPFEVQDVSIVTADQFNAILAAQQSPQTAEQPAALSQPDVETDAPDLPPRPRPEPEAEQSQPEPVATPQNDPVPEAIPEPLPPQPETDVTAQVPQPEAPDALAALQPLPEAPRPVQRPVDRVAPQPVAPPDPEATPDEVTREEVTPDETGEVEQPEQTATAPEEANDRIVTEADEVPELAPTSSPRPPSARPRPREVETAAVAEPSNTEDAVNAALAEVLGQGDPAPAAPSGPPMTSGEKDALRVSVSRCWNVGSLSSAALSTTVVVSVGMAQDGRPDTGSIRMLSSSGGDDTSARQAFEAARRAIIRCGANGYDLPADKYAQWREIEMTFNPERMRIR